MVSAMNRMLLRSVRHLGGQVVTIALVLGCGIMSMIMMLTTYGSLLRSRDVYYAEQRFGDVFARLERAPDAVASRIEKIPGVAIVYPRLVKEVMVPLPDELEAIEGRVVSIPDDRPPPLNGLFLVEGRYPASGAANEVVIFDQFAAARALSPGDRLPAVLDGQLRNLEIVGLAMSPEFLFASAGRGGIIDPSRFVVIWMPRKSLAPIFRIEGAFNDVVFGLEEGASIPAVLDAVDRELAPFGGFHAVERAKQASNYALNNELTVLKNIAVMVPMAFLGVAAFLVSIVLSRLVLLERQQIAILKALGRKDRRIGLHYLGLVVIIVGLAAVLGIASGIWSGRWMVGVYARTFHFPRSEFELTAGIISSAVGVGFLAAAGGALWSVARVVKMPPAQAMRPPAPPIYRRTFLSRLGLDRVAGASMTMIVRGIVRNPLRFLFSTLGIAMGIGIYIFGMMSWDSFGYLMHEIYPREHREDLAVTFTRSVPARAIRELEHLPGVELAEGTRTLPARFRSGPASRDTVIVALPHPSELRHLFDRLEDEVVPPDEGLIMTDKLAEVLGVRPGDHVEAEIMEGDFARHEIPVVALIHEPFGLQAYAQRAWIDKLLGEEPRVNAALLRIDPLRDAEVRARLADLPSVISVLSTPAVVDAFDAQTGSWLSVMIAILGVSAAAIAIGIVYNNARIALSMRSRDLASLRVLGFRRKEISMMLLGELALQVMIGIPMGLVVGNMWARYLAAQIESEMIRFPLHLADRTYATAAAIALVAGVVSALFVRRKLDDLDLIGVLKASE